MKNTDLSKSNQTQPSHLPRGFGAYLANYHDALQAHMHPLHKLGNANIAANYHEYFQTLIKMALPMELLATLT